MSKTSSKAIFRLKVHTTAASMTAVYLIKKAISALKPV